MFGTRRVGNISRALRDPVAAVFGSEGGSCSPGAHNTSEELQVLNSEWQQSTQENGDTGGKLARHDSDGGFRPLFPSQTAVLDLNGTRQPNSFCDNPNPSPQSLQEYLQHRNLPWRLRIPASGLGGTGHTGSWLEGLP